MPGHLVNRDTTQPTPVSCVFSPGQGSGPRFPNKEVPHTLVQLDLKRQANAAFPSWKPQLLPGTFIYFPVSLSPLQSPTLASMFSIYGLRGTAH